jgi:hypothetical protein
VDFPDTETYRWVNGHLVRVALNIPDRDFIRRHDTAWENALGLQYMEGVSLGIETFHVPVSVIVDIYTRYREPDPEYAEMMAYQYVAVIKAARMLPLCIVCIEDWPGLMGLLAYFAPIVTARILTVQHEIKQADEDERRMEA